MDDGALISIISDNDQSGDRREKVSDAIAQQSLSKEVKEALYQLVEVSYAPVTTRSCTRGITEDNCSKCPEGYYYDETGLSEVTTSFECKVGFTSSK